MALIKCPECGKQVSDKASSCPNCGCPVSSSNNKTATGVKIRCLTDDRKCVGFTFRGGTYNQYCGIGNVLSIPITKPTRLEVIGKLGILPMNSTFFTAEPGKCYEVKYCKPGIWQWQTVVNEVSSIV